MVGIRESIPDSQALRQHMAMMEQAIAGTFVDHSLPVHLLGGVQGPHTLSFGLRLYRPTARNLSKASRLAPAIEAAIGDGPVRIYTERGVVWVEVPSPWPVNVPGSKLRGKGLAVPLGLTARQAVAGVDFTRDPHLLIVGPTGRGKTTAARSIVYHLARQNSPDRVQFVLVTFKPGDWQAAGRLSHTLGLVREPQEAGKMLDWARQEMQRRAAQGVQKPHLFLVLDDLLNLLALVKAADALAEIASLGRGAGLHLVVGTQRLGKRGAGDAAVTGNMPVRLVFGTADSRDAAAFTGRGGSGAEGLGRYPGDALLVAHGNVQRLAISPVSDRDLVQLATGAASHRNGHGDPGPGVGALVAQGGRRALTPEERAYIRAVYERTGGNKTETCMIVWGYKNGDVWAWLEEALAEAR